MVHIVPYFEYRDACAALGRLVEAFGFTLVIEVTDDEGRVQHA